MNLLRTVAVVVVVLSGLWLSFRSFADPITNDPPAAPRSTQVTENGLADLPAYARAMALGQNGPSESSLISTGCN